MLYSLILSMGGGTYIFEKLFHDKFHFVNCDFARVNRHKNIECMAMTLKPKLKETGFVGDTKKSVSEMFRLLERMLA